MPLAKKNLKPLPYESEATFPYRLLTTILATSMIIQVINVRYYHFIGNNYIPIPFILMLLLFGLTYIGLILQIGKLHWLTKKNLEVLNYLIVITAIALLSNAIQLTPFAPIDDLIIRTEQALHIDLPKIMGFWAQYPICIEVLRFIYDSLTFQLILIPLLVIIFGEARHIRRFYKLVCVSVLLGFGIYYFYPTIAPASMLQSSYFMEVQYATGLKFNAIHQGFIPTTDEGGLIAFPSFHVIWAWFCVYLLRPWPVLFWVMLGVNSLIPLSCVAIGWHYVLDIAGAFIVILLTHLLVKFQKMGQ